jgi:hypothetical protein
VSRRRRRPSTPLAILAGACLGLALAGALHLIVMLAVGGLALGLAAATVQIRRYAAELAAGRARTARQHRPPVTITPAAPARPRQPYAHDASGLPLDRCPATFGRLRCTRTEAHPERAHRNGPYGWGTGPPSMATIRAAGLEGDELAEALRATLRPAGDRLSSRIPPPAATTGGTP